MRRVSGQETVAFPPAGGHQTVESIRCGPNDGMRRVADPGRDQRADDFRFRHSCVLFAGQEHEFPAPVRAATRHDRHGPGGIAEHHRHVLEIRCQDHTGEVGKGASSFDLRVHDQPGLLELEIIERDPEDAADRASAAVGAEHPPRHHGTAIPEEESHVVSPLLESHYLDTETEGDIGITMQTGASVSSSSGWKKK